MTTDELIERIRGVRDDAYLSATYLGDEHVGDLMGEILAVFEQAQAEPKWEYGTTCAVPECIEPHPLGPEDEPPIPEETLWRRTKERYVEAGLWEPVGATDE